MFVVAELCNQKSPFVKVDEGSAYRSLIARCIPKIYR